MRLIKVVGITALTSRLESLASGDLHYILATCFFVGSKF